MTAPHPSALRGRDVLVTGHTGFKGSWLALWLAALGARTTGYALAPETDPALFEVAGVADVLHDHVVGDVRDRDAVDAVVARSRPDVVLHLAARTVVSEGYRRPAEAFSVNVDGTTAVLDAVRAADRPCAVVVVTSDKCYLNDESGRPFRETDPLGGHDPYSASKAAQELVVQSYRRSYFDPQAQAAAGCPVVRLASGRAGNVIGGGDWTEDGLVADLARAPARGGELVLRSPHAVRPWQHVLEPLSGYLTLAAALLQDDADALAGAYNFGPHPEDDATVAELVDGLSTAWGPLADGSRGWRSEPHEDLGHEAGVLRLDVELAARALSWTPTWRLGETLGRTADWYRGFGAEPASARDLCREDIAAFEGAVSGSATRGRAGAGPGPSRSDADSSRSSGDVTPTG
ncbi:CDP-glucose 4,6-dehydratase [Klenkia terrae]|uniref:CDP-glucose 4,6-dehydratase n=1 Tax=Klenkia terrae TaxID=1052259 RepID=A0ABU8ECP6_9ACTN